MDWRLRVDIPKRNQVFFFQDNVSWNFTGDDFLENRHGLTKLALQFGQIFCRGKFFANEKKDLRAQNIASPRPYTRTALMFEDGIERDVLQQCQLSLGLQFT